MGRALHATVSAGGLAIPLSGCATLQNVMKSVGYQDPSVEIVSMAVTDWRLTQLGTTFDVAIRNPNSVGFTLQGIQYGLKVDGHQLTTGRSETPVTVAANGSTTTKLAFDFPLAETANALIALLSKPEVDYALDSAFEIGRPDFAITVPVNKTGRLPLPKLPQFGVPTAEYQGASMAGVKVRFVPTLANPNDFDLPIEGFETSLKINQRPVLTNQARPAATLAAGTETPVPIDVTLSLADLGLSALSLISKPRLDWAVDFSLLAGSLKLPFSASGRLRLG